VEHINPYAVIRNTATYEAYKAYIRKSYGAGQPFIILGLLPTFLMPMATTLLGSRTLHVAPIDLRWAMAAVFMAFALGAVSFAIGVLRVAKYRREHPMPDEWRQVPRVSWPPVPARTPRLP
jgi:hypothetical protein